MATDQASADYEREQENRAALQDDQADWAEDEKLPPTTPSVPRVCARCVNWKSPRLLSLKGCTPQEEPGFCTSTTAAGLRKNHQAYAECCQFFEEEIPF